MADFPTEFLFLCGAHFDQILRLEDDVKMGSSNPAQLEHYPGGAALNSASVAAALGLKSALVSPIGKDVSGKQLIELCNQRHIEPMLVETEAHPTGLYCALLTPEGNVIVGASDLSVYDTIDREWLSENLPRCQGLFVTANLDSLRLEQAVDHADFIAAATISQAKASRLKPILSKMDILFTNVSEARALSGLAEADSFLLAEWLMGEGVRSGTISNGASDLVYFCDEQIKSITVHKNNRLADVNGAGDALAGGVLAGLADGMTFAQAVDYGNAVAAYSTEFKGPYPDGLSRDKIKERYFQ